MDNRQIRTDIYLSDFDGSVDALLRIIDSAFERVGATRETGCVCIELDSGYYDSGATLEAYVYRMETDEEWAERERRQREDEAARAALARQQTEASERQLLAQLKAKYGADA
jgi:hypothetical protein